MLSVFLAAVALQQPAVPDVSTEAAPIAVPAVAPATPEPPAPPTSLKLPALTVIRLAIDEDMISKTATIGQEFGLRLVSPIDMGQGLVVPAGTKGRGWVIHASKAKLGGKAGELLLGARYLELGDVKIPLRSLKLGSPQGKDNTGLAMGVMAAAGVAGVFISGGQARVTSGNEAMAKIAADTDIPVRLLSPAPILEGVPIVATPVAPPAMTAVEPAQPSPIPNNTQEPKGN